MYIWWIFVFLAYKTVADESGSELANSGDIFQVKVNTKDIGRIKYQDGEVVIAQNQQKHTDFFFIPFPYLQSDETQCHESVLSDRIELGLQVELYTPQLIQAVKEYLYKYQPSLCGNTTSSFVCDVSLLPMNAIRLVQRSSRSNSIHHKYTLEDSWQPATLLLQSIEFVIYASNMTVCEQLRRALTEKCRLPNFEVHYSLHGQQTVQRQLEVNTEHVASTNMYNQIRAQFPSAETVVLTGNDFKELISESTDRITMMLRAQEGFENLQDPMAIDKLLEKQLSTQQVQLQITNDKLWENLYWTPELTRPDRLAKVLNSIIRIDSGDSERFVYDRQAAKDAMKVDLTQHDISEVYQSRHDIDHFKSSKQYGDRAHLTRHDKQRLQQLDKLFDSYSRSSSSSNARSDNDDVIGGFEFFGLFKVDGGSSGATQTRSESSDNQPDVSDKQHENVSDVDILNETPTDKHDLNVLGIRRSHLNTTGIDKERSTNGRKNNNNLNEMKTNTNNLTATKIDKDTNKQYTFSRNDVDKFLRELSNNVYLAGDIINPRLINARLVNIEKISTNTKLFSNPVLVRMRSNVHALPLRCKPGDNGGKSKLWLTDRIDRIDNVLLNLSNHVVEITKLLHDEIRNVQDKISELRNKTEETVANWKQEMDTALRKINVQTDHLYTNLTDMVKQTINATSSKINIAIDNLNRNLTNTMKQDNYSISRFPEDCAAIYLSLRKKEQIPENGIYEIWPREGKPIEVLCDMKTDGGGWIVFQKRDQYDHQLDFYRTWLEYKRGFGDLKQEFWLGNDRLSMLTNQDSYQLRVDLEDFDGEKRFAEYSFMRVYNEETKYKLTLGSYAKGNAGNNLRAHSGMKFSTKDQDNDLFRESCAQVYNGAWWYAACHESNLNGGYLKGAHPSVYAAGVNWGDFRGHHYSLKSTEMKIRPTWFKP